MTTKLGPQHELHGGAVSEPWLPHTTTAKFTGDLGLSSVAPPEVLTVGRIDDMGMIEGQGFDANRYYDQGVDPVSMAAHYYNVIWAEKIPANPGLLVIEGPNEQVIKRPEVMAWYGEFCYAWARIVFNEGHSLSRPLVAGIGSWATGNPEAELYLWPHWTKALQATVDWGAIFCRHCYGLLNEAEALRYRWDLRVFNEAFGFDRVKCLVTEAADFGGIAKYGFDIRRYWDEYLLPLQREYDKDTQLIGAHLFSVGGSWQEYNVAPFQDQEGKSIADYAIAYQPLPPPEPEFPRWVTIQGVFVSNLRSQPGGEIIGIGWRGRKVFAEGKEGTSVRARVYLHETRVK